MSVAVAEKFLKSMGISYKKSGEKLYVDGHIDLGRRNISVLPDLQSVHLWGNFYCNSN